MIIDDAEISVDSVSAAWYRKPQFLEFQHADPLTRQAVEREALSTLELVWSVIPSDVWLNSPSAIREAQIKSRQLREARAAGFESPQTIVTNRWRPVRELLESEPTIVAKMADGTLQKGAGASVMFTNILTEFDVDSLSHVSPFPAIFQPYIRKAREWRVTVVGRAAFPVVIETQPDAMDDWRKHQFTDSVRLVLPERPHLLIERRSVDVVRRLGLGFGALDLIERPNGSIVFLECNPNGQYQWLEDELKLGIGRAIAEFLLRALVQRHS